MRGGLGGDGRFEESVLRCPSRERKGDGFGEDGRVDLGAFDPELAIVATGRAGGLVRVVLGFGLAVDGWDFVVFHDVGGTNCVSSISMLALMSAKSESSVCLLKGVWAWQVVKTGMFDGRSYPRSMPQPDDRGCPVSAIEQLLLFWIAGMQRPVQHGGLADLVPSVSLPNPLVQAGQPTPSPELCTRFAGCSWISLPRRQHCHDLNHDSCGLLGASNDTADNFDAQMWSPLPLVHDMMFWRASRNRFTMSCMPRRKDRRLTRCSSRDSTEAPKHWE